MRWRLPGLTLQDQRRIQGALESSTSANTRRAYDQAWKRWVSWSRARGIPTLPAAPELAAAFLLELADSDLSLATIRLQKTALGAVHRSTGHPDPTDNEGVTRVMAGLAREKGQPPAPGETAHRGGPRGGEGHCHAAPGTPGPGHQGGKCLGCTAARPGGYRPALRSP